MTDMPRISVDVDRARRAISNVRANSRGAEHVERRAALAGLADHIEDELEALDIERAEDDRREKEAARAEEGANAQSEPSTGGDEGA